MVSQVLAQAILNQRTPDVVDKFREGQEFARGERTRDLAGEALRAGGGQALDELVGLNPEVGLALGESIRARSAKDINDLIRDAGIAERMLNTGNDQGALQFVQQRRNAIALRGGDTSQTDQILGLIGSGRGEEARQQLLAFSGSIDQSRDTAGIKEFRFKTEGLTEEETARARRISLGLEAREGIDPREFGLRERSKLEAQVELKPKISGLEETAKSQAKLSTKVVEKSFDTIGKSFKNIANIDRAISAIDRGAKTGAIQRFLPSIKASSIELDQLRNELGLDVIGGVTFGALSKGELDLALRTALPTTLDEAELRDWLVRKRDAQSKLLANMQEAVQFLSKPNATVADFVASKQSTEQGTAQPTTNRVKVDF